jgi:hypothetical protein
MTASGLLSVAAQLPGHNSKLYRVQGEHDDLGPTSSSSAMSIAFAVNLLPQPHGLIYPDGFLPQGWR